jgi:hypothetical protein
VVVADPDEPEELVVDPHVQVLVEEVETLPQRLLRPWGEEGREGKRLNMGNVGLLLQTLPM